MSVKQKKIALDIDALEKVVAGADFLARGLKTTLGPFGRNFILEKGEKVTNDGRNIAAEFECEDEIEHKGLHQLRKASIETEQEVKDASTTTVVLGMEILKSAVAQLPSREHVIGKMTVSEVISKIEDERIEVSKMLDDMAEPITSEEQLIEVAKVATEDEKLAKIIGTAQYQLGKDGILIADEFLGKGIEVEIVRGLMLDNGLANTELINNEEKQSLELPACRVLLTNHVFESVVAGKDVNGKELHRLPIEGLILELTKKGVTDLVIVARAFTPQMIRLCQGYTTRGFGIYPVNAPYVNQAEIMKDMEAVHGGKFINAEDRSISTIGVDDIGYASSIVAERYRAMFTGPEDEATVKRVEDRIVVLKEKLEGKISEFEKERLQQRIAQLSHGFAIIKIGANTDIQRKRIKDKADDAVGTVRMALQEGVVAGGGLALKEISDKLPDSYLLKKPLLCIYEHIMSTAPKGFEIETWVKDPVKTLKTALKYACEVASNLATVGGAIATKKDKPRLVQEVNNDNED